MRPEALRDLIAMNVTPASLFPGLDGLGRASALQARFSTAERDALINLLTTPTFMHPGRYVKAVPRATATSPQEGEEN